MKLELTSKKYIEILHSVAISETRLPVIWAGRVVELRCNGRRVLLLEPHKRRANPSQNVPLKDGEEMRGHYQMAAYPRTTHAACRKGMRRPVVYNVEWFDPQESTLKIRSSHCRQSPFITLLGEIRAHNPLS